VEHPAVLGEAFARQARGDLIDQRGEVDVGGGVTHGMRAEPAAQGPK